MKVAFNNRRGLVRQIDTINDNYRGQSFLTALNGINPEAYEEMEYRAVLMCITSFLEQIHNYGSPVDNGVHQAQWNANEGERPSYIKDYYAELTEFYLDDDKDASTASTSMLQEAVRYIRTCKGKKPDGFYDYQARLQACNIASIAPDKALRKAQAWLNDLGTDDNARQQAAQQWFASCAAYRRDLGAELGFVIDVTDVYSDFAEDKATELRTKLKSQDEVMEDLRRAQPLFGAILTYVNKVIFDAAQSQGIPASDYDLLQMRNAFFIELTKQFAHEYAKPEANFTHDELQNRLVSLANIDGFLTYQLKDGRGKPTVDASGQPLPATLAPTFLTDGSFPIGQMIFEDSATRDKYKNILDRAKAAADQCLVPLLKGEAIPKALRPKLTVAVQEAAQKSSPLGQFFLGGQAVAINLDQPIPVKLARGADDQAARQFMIGEITKFFEFSVPEQIAQVHHTIFHGTVDQATSQQLHDKLTAKSTAGRTKDLIATATAINDNTDPLLQQTLPDGTKLQHSTGNMHTTHTYDALDSRKDHNHNVAKDRFKQKIGTGVGTVLLTGLLIGLQFVPGVGQGVMIALLVFAVIAFVAGAALTAGLHVSQKHAESNERKLEAAAQHANDKVHQQQQELEGTGVTTTDLPGSLVSETAMAHRAKHGYTGVTAKHYTRPKALNVPKAIQFAADDSELSSDSEYSSEDPDGLPPRPARGGSRRAEERGEDSSEERGEDSSEERGEDSSEERGEDSSEERGEDSSEERGEDSSEERGEDSSEERGEDSSEERGEDSSEERGEDSSEERGEDSSEERGEDSSEERGEDSSEERGEDSSEERGEESSEELGEESSEELGEDDDSPVPGPRAQAELERRASQRSSHSRSSTTS